jgi:nucleoside-diphosphate-sugar epimerase
VFNRGSQKIAGLEQARQATGDRRDARSFIPLIQALGTFDCVMDMICYERADAESLVEAIRERTSHLIFCSTVDVYSKPASRYPITEAEPHRPVNAYGEGKAQAEAVVSQAAGREIPQVTIIRPAHTYGPESAHRGNFVHAFGSSTTFLDRLRRGKPVIVPGDGSALRGSCHVKDVSAAFVNAMQREGRGAAAYHVTSEEWLTWNRYHEILAGVLGGPPPVLVHIPTDILSRVAPKRAVRCRENYQFNGVYDNSAARRDLHYEYSVPFEQGARETLEWLQASGGIDNSDGDEFYEEILTAWNETSSTLERQLRERER